MVARAADHRTLELHPALLPQTYAEALRQLADSTGAVQLPKKENTHVVARTVMADARADEQAMLAGG